MSIQIQPVLMSGGSGTRLWPISRQARPKQFASFLGSRTPFQETVLRVSGRRANIEFLPPIVIGAVSHAEAIKSQMAALGEMGRVVLEPAPRNTAPCAAVAAALATKNSPDTLVLLLPCDHVIGDVAAFHNALKQGAAAAEAGYIVTFGVRPEGPQTAYGYIKAGQAIGDAFAVARFAEKPDSARAQSYLDEGNWTWNAGIFLFRAGTMILEMQRHAPDILSCARAALESATNSEGATLLGEDAFKACPSESIDYAVAEKTASAAVVPVSMRWSDVGLWSAVWEQMPKNEAGIAATGDVTTVDARDCLVISDGPPVMLAGVEDLAVIVENGVVLVTKRAASSSVKSLVETLATVGRDELL